MTSTQYFSVAALLFAFATIVDGSTATAQQPVVIGDMVVRLIDQVDVPALEMGSLSSLDVRLGETVQANQQIARIDDRAAVAAESLAQTTLEISKRNSSNYREDQLASKDVDQKKVALIQQQSISQIAKEKSNNPVRVSAAEKAEAVAKNEWSRASEARKQFVDSVSQSELDNLRLKFDRARLERIQAEFDLRMDRLSSDVESQAVKAAQAASDRAEIAFAIATNEKDVLKLDVDAKEKELRLRQIAVERHRVVSPIDGMVVEVYRRAGEWVRPGDPVVKIVNTQRLYAEGFLSGNVRPKRGQSVSLISEKTRVEGVVEFVSPERDPVSGEVRFLIRFDGGLMPGARVGIQW